MNSAEDLVVLVDENDIAMGYRGKEECHVVHNGVLGYHHRGLTVMVYNSKGEVLLQHRKHTIFDRVLDLAGSTHPYFRGGKQESYEEAAERCLKSEYRGFEYVKVESSNIAVNYSAIDPLNNRYCENEFCRLIIAVHDGAAEHDDGAAYGHSWVPFPSLVTDANSNASRYAPWVLALLKKIVEEKPPELAQLR